MKKRRGCGLELIGRFMDEVDIQSGRDSTPQTLVKYRQTADHQRAHSGPARNNALRTGSETMADDAQLMVRKVDSVAVVETPDCINSDGEESISQACNDLISEQVSRNIRNLHSCSIANSVEISFLIEVLENMREKGGNWRSTA